MISISNSTTYRKKFLNGSEPLMASSYFFFRFSLAKQTSSLRSGRNKHIFSFLLYYRHRLSDAFFMKAARCRWQDVFPNCVGPAGGIFDLIRRVIKRLLRDNEEDANKELKLDDLKDVSPIFISSITVNDWQISSDAKSSHQLISFSSKGVELIGNDWEKPSKLSKCFEPKHMRLSAAMAISGAAVSYDMGRRESRLNMVLDLLNLLGIGMGDEMVSDQCHFEQQSKSTVGMMKQVC